MGRMSNRKLPRGQGRTLRLFSILPFVYPIAMVNKSNGDHLCGGTERVDRAPITYSEFEKTFPLCVQRDWRNTFEVESEPRTTVYHVPSYRPIKKTQITFAHLGELKPPRHVLVVFLSDFGERDSTTLRTLGCTQSFFECITQVQTIVGIIQYLAN